MLQSADVPEVQLVIHSVAVVLSPEMKFVLPADRTQIVRWAKTTDLYVDVNLPI